MALLIGIRGQLTALRLFCGFHLLACSVGLLAWQPTALAHSGSSEQAHSHEHDSTDASGSAEFVEFIRALKLDDAGSVRKLLLKGFDPNTVTQEGVPVLSFAMFNEAEQCVSTLLLSSKLDVNQSDLNGDTPLMVAAIMDRPAWVAALLEKGATKKQSGQWTALHYAATSGALEAMNMLIGAGSDINALSPNGTTPLMMATRENQDDAALLLLEQGADVLLVNQSGFTAAGYAMAANNDRLAAVIQRHAAAKGQ